MRKRRTVSLPEPVRVLGERIEQWRQSRERKSAMPEELWLEAASLSKTYGVYPVARDLKLHYDRLKRRVFGNEIRPAPKDVEPSGFVEIAGIECFTGAGAPVVTEVEMSRADGSALRIRQTGSREMDLGGLVEAFCRGER